MEKQEVSAQLNAVLKIVYRHIEQDTENSLLVERQENNLSIRNASHGAAKTLSVKTLTILLKDVVNRFAPAIADLTIMATEKIARYRIWPWPKKTVSQEFSVNIEQIDMRGGQVIVKPKNPESAGELRKLLNRGRDQDRREIWLDPIITGFTVNLEKIKTDEK